MLQFIFTEKDFCLDVQSAQEAEGRESWRSRFETDRYHALEAMLANEGKASDRIIADEDAWGLFGVL